jgi:hypothetical protein
VNDTDRTDVPTRADVARGAAWEAFGRASKQTPSATPSDRLRRYAEACQIAADAYHEVRTFGGDDDAAG